MTKPCPEVAMVALLISALATCVSARTDKPAPLPTVAKTTGVYVAYLPGGMSNFIKLVLDENGTGYLIWNSRPMDTKDMLVCRIKKWTLNKYECEIELVEADSPDKMGLYIKCFPEESSMSLRCKLGSRRYKWEHDLDLHSADAMVRVNKETDEALKGLRGNQNKPLTKGQAATEPTKENASPAQTDHARKTAKYLEVASSELSRFTDEWKKPNRPIKAPLLKKTADDLVGIPTSGVDREAINYVKTLTWAVRSIQSHEDLMTHTATIQDGVKPPWFGTPAASAHAVYIDQSFEFLNSIGESVVSRLNARYGLQLKHVKLTSHEMSPIWGALQ